MKSRQRLLYVSIALNILASAVILHQTASRGHVLPTAEPPSPALTPSRLPASAARGSIAEREQSHGGPFDWRRIESEDYRQYIANLRAIGCPERTVQDIIRADVKDLFDARRARIRGTNQVYKFWRTGSETSSLNDEQREQLSELAAEKREVLRSLIGIDEIAPEDFEAGLLNPMAVLDQRLQFLPEDKRQKMKLILPHEADMASSNSAEGQPEAREAIQSLLTEQELHEYDLRESVLAAKLRSGLDKVGPTEEEFRLIYNWWERMEAAKELGDLAYRQWQDDSEADIRQLLGPERFQRYLAGMKVWGYSR